eukprot:c49416_g1_i1 orf=3-227(+)
MKVFEDIYFLCCCLTYSFSLMLWNTYTVADQRGSVSPDRWSFQRIVQSLLPQSVPCYSCKINAKPPSAAAPIAP